MFDFFGLAGVAVVQAMHEHEKEQAMLLALAATMEPAAFRDFVNEREHRRQLAQQEEDVERRHREQCAAIRSTSFWRFGA